MALGNKRTSSQEPNISMTKQAFHSFYGKDHLISSSIQLVLDEGESSQQKLPSSSNSKCNNFVFGSTKNPTLEKEAQSILSFNNGADNCWLQSYNGKAALDDDGFPTWDDVTDHDGRKLASFKEALLGDMRATQKAAERISERLKALQELIPNGSKVLAMDEFWPVQGGKAPEVTQVKEAIDAILSLH
ncbi:putative transcription factor [Acorus gramineus]|uniref:Transcription factor n=1 Tax=Acorus gramineus TaxID=55184 RepID=A0AAV9AXJ2_ACOGR|nr:putative transcription factor [Acorus gramineus]